MKKIINKIKGIQGLTDAIAKVDHLILKDLAYAYENYGPETVKEQIRAYKKNRVIKEEAKNVLLQVLTILEREDTVRKYPSLGKVIIKGLRSL